MRSSSLAATVLVAGTLVLAGCGSGDGDPAAAAPATSSAPSSTAPASTAAPTSTAPTGGCPPTGSAPAGTASAPTDTASAPADTASAPTLDVDGDGVPDTAWIATQPGGDGSVPFGVQTASGGVLTADIASASPLPRSVLVADVTGDGELVALASDGRQVLLFALSGCEIVPVQDAQGQQYAFDLGFTGYGTGVGCADVDGDGTRDLVGLLADGTTVVSTAVELDGPRAANGPSATAIGASAAQVALAHQVSCGSLTLAADGVTSGP